jgi:long-chain acyl-CoA synthetase
MTSLILKPTLDRDRHIDSRLESPATIDVHANGNATPTLGEILRRRALEKADAAALLCDGREMSYRELDESTTALACWLLDQGLEPGERVAIHWSNSIEAAQIFFAIFKAGLIAVPINLRLKAPEAAWILEHSQAKMCFSEPALASMANSARSACKCLQSVLSELPRVSPADAGSLPAVLADQPTAIFYTSGTTARPKGAIHTHRTLIAGARILGDLVLDHNDTALVLTQMMYVAGLGCVLLPAIDRGLPVVLLPAFEPGAALDAIERFRCTYTFNLPALWHMMLEEQMQRPRDVSSLRTLIAGGDCVPVQLQERFAELFDVSLHEGIGMTETFPFACNPRDAIRPGSLGVPPPGVEVRIVDGDDREIPDGEIGAIVVRSPVNCLGYWENSEATKELLRGGWLHTGDLAMRDSDGYLWFKGRKKQIIVRGGSNISPQEVEEVLYQHPAVFEAGVIGVPDPVCGESVVAFVSLRNGATPTDQDLREYARQSLADYKVPEKVFFVPELPKGITGKVNRADLRGMYLQQSG